MEKPANPELAKLLGDIDSYCNKHSPMRNCADKESEILSRGMRANGLDIRSKTFFQGQSSCFSNIVQHGTTENLKNMIGGEGLSSYGERDDKIEEKHVEPKLEKLLCDINDYASTLKARSFTSYCGEKESGFGNEVLKETNKTLSLFRDICKELQQVGEKGHIDFKAWNIMTNKFEIPKVDKCIGPVPGVDVGDEFNYRIEAYLVGLHKQMVVGIDYLYNGTTEVCISIIDLHRGDYSNYVKETDFIIYSGQGGNSRHMKKEFKDQTLNNKGNLALKNSYEIGNPVRVIRGSKKGGCRFYVYDGLYQVVRYWTENASHGRLVFKFGLLRNPGQAPLSERQLEKLNAY